MINPSASAGTAARPSGQQEAGSPERDRSRTFSVSQNSIFANSAARSLLGASISIERWLDAIEDMASIARLQSCTMDLQLVPSHSDPDRL
jgi:hypothetical protein